MSYYYYIISVYQTDFSTLLAMKFLKQFFIQEQITFCYIDLGSTESAFRFCSSEKEVLEQFLELFNSNVNYFCEDNKKYIWKVRHLEREYIEQNYGDDWLLGFSGLVEGEV